MQSEVSPTKPQDPYFRLLKYIVAAIVAAILILGSCVFLFYLTLNLPYIRANIAIALAKGRVTPLYEQLTAMTSPSVQVIEKHDVESGMYAFALSDGADQYAHVWAALKLQSAAPSADVIAAYSNLWATSGLTQIVNDKPEVIDSLFRSFDGEYLLAGICHTDVTSETQNYVVFIDYADGPRCDSSAGGLSCVAARYCSKS